MPMPILPDMAGIMDILERGLALERVSPLPPRVDTRLGLVRPERSLLPSLPRSLWSSCSTVPRGEVMHCAPLEADEVGNPIVMVP